VARLLEVLAGGLTAAMLAAMHALTPCRAAGTGTSAQVDNEGRKSLG
jgi:hypothetical protein